MQDTFEYKKNTGIVIVTYFALMSLFAVAWHFALPYNGNIKNYINMVISENWLPINLIGWIGVAFGIFALINLYDDLKKNLGVLGKTGFLIVTFAFLIHFCLISWEAFIYPEITKNTQASFLIADGVFMQSINIIVLYSVFSLTFSIGFLLLGISLIKSKIFPRTPVLMIIIGAFIYSFAVAIGGYAGLVSFLVYLLGMLFLGITIIKRSHQQ